MVLPKFLSLTVNKTMVIMADCVNKLVSTAAVPPRTVKMGLHLKLFA